MKPKMHPNYFHLMHHCMLFKIKKIIFAPPLKQLRFWQTSQSLLILNSLCSTCHTETSFHNHHKVFWLKSSSLFYHLKIGFILTTADGAYFRVVSGFAPSGWDRVALTWCHLGQGQMGERERERERKKERRVSLLSSPARWSGHHGCVVPARRCFDTGACVSLCLCTMPFCHTCSPFISPSLYKNYLLYVYKWLNNQDGLLDQSQCECVSGQLMDCDLHYGADAALSRRVSKKKKKKKL